MKSLIKRKKLLEILNTFRISNNNKDNTKINFQLCKKCKTLIDIKELEKNFFVCPHCKNHMKISGIQRFKYLLDENFKIINFNSKILDPIEFPEYEKLRKNIEEKTELTEAITIAQGSINEEQVVVAVLEQDYLMGSLGTYMGEELTSMFEYATEHKIPVIIFSASGGARMQEGIFSLVQMAKTTAAINKFSEENLLYISILTNPTMGGVSASFASLGDIVLAEPEALIGFAGPRVIEQTVKQKLPEGFQKAEKLEGFGFIDFICPREEQKKILGQILKLHKNTGARYECV